jgi:hypothetical protein
MASASSDGFGLDINARIAAQAAADHAANKPAPLDPKFPFVAKPFDPKLFGLDTDPNRVPKVP